METLGGESRSAGSGDSNAFRAEMRKVLSSNEFRSSPRLSRFLEYVVERTLAGEATELKEYRIGVDVFERSDSYDPRTDPVVRVEAVRLRRKLATFYHSEGRDSEFRLEVPKGSYGAVLEAVGRARSASQPNEISDSYPSNSVGGSSGQDSWRLLMAVALSGALLATVAYVTYRSAVNRRLPFDAITTGKITHSGNATLVAISPDGKYVLNALSEDGLESLWLRNIASGSDVQIVVPEPVHYRGLQFSRDGNFLYFVRSEGEKLYLASLFRLPVLGGQPEQLISDIDTNISFSPDGKTFAFVTNSADEFRLRIASQDGRSQRDLIRGPMSRPISDPAWSPDGRTIAAVTGGMADPISTLVTIDAVTGQQSVLYKSHTANLQRPVWLPDGSGLLVLVGDEMTNFMEQQISLVTYPRGEMHLVTRESNNYMDLSIASDGHTLATVLSESRWDLFVAYPGDPDNAHDQQLTSDESIRSFNWTTGDELVIWQDSGLSLLNPVTGARHRIQIPSPDLAIQPSVCRDGQVLFVLSTTGGDGVQSIWRIDSDGRNLTRVTQDRHDRFPICTSDSQSAYYEDFKQVPNFWKVPLAGGAAHPVWEHAMVSNPASIRFFDVSPDGKWAIVSTFLGTDPNDPKPKLVLLPLVPGASRQVLDVRRPIWLPIIRFAGDSEWLAYCVRTQGVDNLWAQQVNGSGSRQLTHFPAGHIWDFEFSPRTGQLAFTRRYITSNAVLIRDSSR